MALIKARTPLGEEETAGKRTRPFMTSVRSNKRQLLENGERERAKDISRMKRELFILSRGAGFSLDPSSERQEIKSFLAIMHIYCQFMLGLERDRGMGVSFPPISLGFIRTRKKWTWGKKREDQGLEERKIPSFLCSCPEYLKMQ